MKERHCAVAESYGALLYCNTFTQRQVKFVTASREFAQRLVKLFKKAFGLEFDHIAQGAAGAKSILSIETPE